MKHKKNYYLKSHNDNNVLHFEYYRETRVKERERKYQALVDHMEISAWKMQRNMRVLSQIEDLGK